MNEVSAIGITFIDRTLDQGPESRVQSIVHDMMSLGDVAMRFSQVKRVPRYDCNSRENDAEHSFMLALVATELAASYCPALDTGLVSQYALVHDLIELKTDDVATFTLSDAEIAAKEADELEALAEQVSELPAYTGRLLLRYELQRDQESTYVRLVDKALPVIVDILGPGAQVMHEDYGIDTPQQLSANEARLSAKFRQKFPNPLFDDIHEARDILAAHFACQFAAGLTEASRD